MRLLEYQATSTEDIEFLICTDFIRYKFKNMRTILEFKNNTL